VISKLLLGESLATWALFLEIILSGAVVVILASRLTKLADQFAETYNLGRAWVGMLLLAGVTSLPEVVTGSTAVWLGNANMALAALFGSCSFNLILIVVINGVMGGGSVLTRADGSHSLTSAFGIILMSLALLAITLVRQFQAQPAAAQTTEIVVSLLIAVCYCGFVRLTYKFEQGEPRPPELVAEARVRTPGLGSKITMISVLLVIAAWWLTQTGNVLAAHPIGVLGRPLGATFVGAAFLALATSLPEVATCVAAVKLGHLDLALGNIFGSNMFNILVVPMLKVVSVVSGDNLLLAGAGFNALQATITGLLPILLTAITVASLAYRTKRRILRFGYDSILLAGCYLIGMYLLFSEVG
jgi:cation:H+ antiporter